MIAAMRLTKATGARLPLTLTLSPAYRGEGGSILAPVGERIQERGHVTPATQPALPRPHDHDDPARR